MKGICCSLGDPRNKSQGLGPLASSGMAEQKGRARAGATQPSKVHTPRANGIIGLLHPSCICMDDPDGLSSGWCVPRLKLSCPCGWGLWSLGQSAANLFGSLAKQLVEYLERNNFKALSYLLAAFNLMLICLLIDICVELIFAFLIPSRKHSLLELHIELNSKVYDWNSRVSAKERYCVWLQHTLRKKLILSCK